MSQALPTLRLAMLNTLPSRLHQSHLSRISTSPATRALTAPTPRQASRVLHEGPGFLGPCEPAEPACLEEALAAQAWPAAQSNICLLVKSRLLLVVGG